MPERNTVILYRESLDSIKAEPDEVMGMLIKALEVAPDHTITVMLVDQDG